MARQKREKVDPYQEGYYHAFNRCVYEIEVFETEEEKNRFFNILYHLLECFFVTLVGTKLMDNHYHLVFKIQIPEDVTAEEIEERYKKLYPDSKFDPKKIKEYELRLGDISEFMKCLQERFAKQYNSDRGRYGHVWAGRFGSNILADEEAILNCLSYLDLNGQEAGKQEEPEDDPYSTIGMTVQRQELEKIERLQEETEGEKDKKKNKKKRMKRFKLLKIDIDKIVELTREIEIPELEAELEARYGKQLEYLGEERKKGFIKYMAFVRKKRIHGFYGAIALFTKRGYIIGKKSSIKKISKRLKYNTEDTLKFYEDKNSQDDDELTIAR
jgi:hypothetical protein